MSELFNSDKGFRLSQFAQWKPYRAANSSNPEDESKFQSPKHYFLNHLYKSCFPVDAKVFGHT